MLTLADEEAHHVEPTTISATPSTSFQFSKTEWSDRGRRDSIQP